ncbi:ATP-binding protein [Phyllobacterium sp. LjRoot231]|uniref:AAA family ATPase n=1 Tax=Phyllobacterium sp. LjRoot231 TaxID=3342289 RepID=UPI003ED03C41
MSKKTNNLRRNISQFLAHCAMSKACRNQYQLRYGLPVVLGIVVPDPDDIEVYTAIVDYVANKEARTWGFGVGRYDAEVVTLKHSGKGQRPDSKNVLRSLANTQRVIVVADCLDALPTEFSAVADGVVEILPPDPRHIRAAAWVCVGERISLAEASTIAENPLKIIAVAMRPGRSIKKSISLLEGFPGKGTSSPNLGDGPLLKDLHGLGEAGQWGEELAIDLADWKFGKIGWAEVDRGILLSGPPGTGKTTFAGALARTCGAHLVIASLARWQSMGHLGDLLKAMRASFNSARINTPSILFIDEIDAVGDRDKATGDNRQYHIEVVSGLLEQLDGAEKREGVVVVGACNNPAFLDPVLTRAGRLDRHIKIPLPDVDARLGILRWHLRNDLTDDELGTVVEAADGWSGAAIEKLVRDGRRLARRRRRGLQVGDLIECLPERYTFSASFMRRNAFHEVGHAIVGLELGVGNLVEIRLSDSVEIDGASHQEGGIVHFDEISNLERLPAQILDRIALNVAGAAAEQVFLGVHGSGWAGVRGSDLHRATLLALSMEASYGHGETFLYLADDTEPELTAAMRLNPLLQQKVRQILGQQFDRAKDILNSRRVDVEAIVQALLRERHLTGGDVLRILKGTLQ